MELRMNFVSLIKLKDAVKINDINCEIIDYQINDNEIDGILSVNGKYQKDDLENTHSFSEEVPFNIVFLENNFEVEDLDCMDLNYDLIEGRGLELSFDVKVEYDLIDEEHEAEVTPIIEDEIINDDESTNQIIIESLNEAEIEEMKEKVTEDINSKLFKSINLKDDNLPENKEIISLSDEKRTKIKVCYFKNDNELEEICRNNQISIDKVFKSNINNDINKHRRVILK